MAKTDGVARIIALAALGKNGGGSTGGTTNYLELANKPKINNVELTGNKTLEDLGINIPDLENYYTKDMVNEAFLTKTNTTSFTPTGDYNPATKKYVDDSKNYVGEFRFLILDDIYSLTKEYFDSVLLPAVKSVGWEKVVVILSHSIGYNAMGLYMFHQKIESTDEDGNAIQTIIFETIHPNIWEQYKSYYTSGSMLIEPTITQIVLTITNDEFANATFNYKRSGSGPRINLLPIAEDAKNAPKVFIPTYDAEPATKKYVDDALANIDVSFDDVYVVTCGHRFDGASFEVTDDGSITEMMNIYWPKYLANSNQGGLVIWKDYTAYTNGTTLIGYMRGAEIYIQWPWTPQNNGLASNPYGSVGVVTITGSWDSSTETYTLTKAVWNRTNYVPTKEYNPATKKYVDDNVKTYTAGENIIISEDNVISANVSGGIDSNAVYTYYAPYSDDDWFTEENVAIILQTVRDKGYSNFEMCTLNGNHYALRQGGNLQALTATDEAFELLSQQNNLENHTNYTFNAHLNENNKVVVSGLVKTVHTAEEMFGTYLPETLKKISGYDGTREHLILQANAGNLEWDSSLDGGIFGDSYTDPTYYTEKQVDKIVTDTVNEALGGRY